MYLSKIDCNRRDIHGNKYGDIRGFYKYVFFEDKNKVYLKLRCNSTTNKSFIIDINTKDFSSVKETDFIHKYRVKERAI